MKKIFNTLKAHFKADFHLPLYTYFIFFLIVCTSINYYYKFESEVLDGAFGKPWSIPIHILFYYFAYFGIAVPQAFILQKQARFQQQEFWIKTLVFVGLVGLVDGFSYYRALIPDESITYLERNFLFKVTGEFKRVALFSIPLYLLYRYYDYQSKNLYGFAKENKFDHKPYLLMLLIMVPLIAIASFENSFIKTYPRFKPWLYDDIFSLPKLIPVLIFELVYGLDFIFVEWIYRGAMVIGLARIMGKDTILPMVSTYAFLHFGKPLGETVGSVFGGYILGVIALNSRNIIGGVYIHMGVAYFMEAFAYIQHYITKP
ncbi:MAG: hypothetical protein AAGI07_01770 [Bacteroidota bacterium]